MVSSANPSSSKTPKLSSMDLISKLPDFLLCHILSFLSLKVVVSTSILSKRWQNLWTLVPNLDIDADDMEGHDMSFEHIMCRIFILREEWCIRKFRLNCPNYPFDLLHLRSWICATVARNVEELDLFLICSPGMDLFELPRTLFSSKTLVVLKLVGRDIVISVASSVQLPCLKVLHLDRVRYKDDDTVRNIFSGCPVLHDLVVVRGGYFDNVNGYEISSPTLRYLKVYNENVSVSEDSLLKLTVNAPALIYLNLHDCFSRGFAFKNLDNLVEAIIAVTKNLGDIAMDVVRALGNVKFLELNCYVINVFHQMAKFPNFQNLIELKLANFRGSWNLLRHLLQNSPYLKHLAINMYYCEEPQCWIHPLLVPHCVSFYLETVEFQGFEGLESEIEFSGYILNKSANLREMTITYNSLSYMKEMFGALKKLSMFERASTKCRLKFEEKQCF